MMIICSVVEWLERRDYKRHGLGSKSITPFCCVLEKNTYGTSPCLVVLGSNLNFCHISNKTKIKNFFNELRTNRPRKWHGYKKHKKL